MKHSDIKHRKQYYNFTWTQMSPTRMILECETKQTKTKLSKHRTFRWNFANRFFFLCEANREKCLWLDAMQLNLSKKINIQEYSRCELKARWIRAVVFCSCTKMSMSFISLACVHVAFTNESVFGASSKRVVGCSPHINWWIRNMARKLRQWIDRKKNLLDFWRIYRPHCQLNEWRTLGTHSTKSHANDMRYARPQLYILNIQLKIPFCGIKLKKKNTFSTNLANWCGNSGSGRSAGFITQFSSNGINWCSYVGAFLCTK